MEHQPDEIHPNWYGKSCVWRDPGPRPRCPDCGGSGTVLLLVSTRPCERCAGTGTIVECQAPSTAEAAKLHFEPPPATEWQPPILSTYTYENDILVSEKRLICKDGRWWEEQFVVADGDLQPVSRAPTTPPPGVWPGQ